MRKASLIDEIAGQLRVVSTQAVVRSQLIADRLNIGVTDLESLEVIAREGTMTAGRLAELMGLTTGAITGLVDRLVRAGYVTRGPDPDDRRKVLIQLNMQQVARAVFPLYAGLARSVHAYLDTLTVDQLKIIAKFLQAAVALSEEDLQQLSR
ncbi:MAG TPA: MarR family transcriptional regulator [Longimicrobiales bacterium]